MNPFNPPRQLCTVCLDDAADLEYHVLQCGHGFHFDCIYSMVIHGRHYKCPNCRLEFTESWFEGFDFFIKREADRRNEGQLIKTRISQLRQRWVLVQQGLDPDDIQERQLQVEQNSPPPLTPQVLAQEEDDGLMMILQSQQAENRNRGQYPAPSSLIPDRRSAARRRQRQLLSTASDQIERDADDEQETSSSSA